MILKKYNEEQQTKKHLKFFSVYFIIQDLLKRNISSFFGNDFYKKQKEVTSIFIAKGTRFCGKITLIPSSSSAQGFPLLEFK